MLTAGIFKVVEIPTASLNTPVDRQSIPEQAVLEGGVFMLDKDGVIDVGEVVTMSIEVFGSWTAMEISLLATVKDTCAENQTLELSTLSEMQRTPSHAVLAGIVEAVALDGANVIELITLLSVV